MVDEVRRLLSKPLVPERRYHDLNRLLPHLLGQAFGPALDQGGRVRPLRHLPVTLRYRLRKLLHHNSEASLAVRDPDSFSLQLGVEAALFAGVAGRPARLDPVE